MNYLPEFPARRQWLHDLQDKSCEHEDYGVGDTFQDERDFYALFDDDLQPPTFPRPPRTTFSRPPTIEPPAFPTSSAAPLPPIDSEASTTESEPEPEPEPIPPATEEDPQYLFQSGAVIAKNYIITVLAFWNKIEYIDCHFGINEVNDRYLSMRVLSSSIKVREDKPFNDYDDEGEPEQHRRLALLKLPERLSFKRIKSLTLPPVIDYSLMNKIVEFAAYGVSHNGSGHEWLTEQNLVGHLKKLYIKIRKQEECVEGNPNFNESKFGKYICGVPIIENTGPCLGDEGTPLVVRQDNGYILAGILLRLRKECGTPVLFLHISEYLKWIGAMVNQVDVSDRFEEFNEGYDDLNNLDESGYFYRLPHYG